MDRLKEELIEKMDRQIENLKWELKDEMKQIIEDNQAELKAYVEDKVLTVKEDMTKLIKRNKQDLAKEINANTIRINKCEQMVIKESNELGNKINKIEKEVAEGIKELGENMIMSDNLIISDLTEFVGNEVQLLQNQVDNNKQIIERKLVSMEKQVNENINESRQIPNNNTQIIKPFVNYFNDSKNIFNGNIKKYHAIPFIGFLQNKHGLFPNFQDFKEYIREHLEDEALLWFCNKENDIQDFEEFRNRFLEYFWGNARQKIVQNELHSGRFDYNRGNSFHRYAMQLYSSAQYLEANFTEEYIVNMIIQHFDETIEEIMALYNFNTMDSLCQFLIP